MTNFNYAIVDSNDLISNVVVADTDKAATILEKLIPKAKSIILVTDVTGPAIIGGDVFRGKFRPPSPFSSWHWDENNWSWAAPVPYPEDGSVYTWIEDEQSWIEVVDDAD